MSIFSGLCFNIKFKTSKLWGTFDFLNKFILSILICVSVELGLKFINFLYLCLTVFGLKCLFIWISFFLILKSFGDIRDIFEVLKFLILFNKELFALYLLSYPIDLVNPIVLEKLSFLSFFSVSYSYLEKFLIPEKLKADLVLLKFLLFFKNLLVFL